jgi:hypothetical protein
VLETALLPCGPLFSLLCTFSRNGQETTFIPYKLFYNFGSGSFDMQTFYEPLFKSLSKRGF